MKHLRLFETEADYNAATLDLPVISYVKKTGNVYYNGKHAVDRVLNAPLMNMCVANGWAKESNDYLTYEEAAVVGGINLDDFATYEVVSAWELKYFTGVNSIVIGSISSFPLIEYFYVPDSCSSTLFSDAITMPNIRKLHFSDAATRVRNEPIAISGRANYSGSIVYIGKNVTKTDGAPLYPFSGFETVIWGGTPSAVMGDSSSTGTMSQSVYVPDDAVETTKTLKPYTRITSSIHGISEYIGDTDY